MVDRLIDIYLKSFMEYNITSLLRQDFFQGSLYKIFLNLSRIFWFPPLFKTF